MSIKLIKEDLQKIVNITNRFVPLRPSLPVLGNIYVAAQKGRLVLQATNLESSIRLSTAAKSAEEWATTVPAKFFVEVLNSLKGREVELNLEKENLLINTQETEGSLATISASEFPKPPFVETVQSEAEVSVKETYTAIGRVAFAASQDEGKPVLTSIFITKEKDATVIVATDGYRLAKQALPNSYGLKDLLVPARIFVEALKAANDTEEEQVGLAVSAKENQLLVVGENLQVATRLISGTYPNFNQIIPQSFVASFVVAKEDLAAAVKTTAVFARDLGNVVTFELTKNNELLLNAATLQVGEASTKLTPEITGEPVKVSFNSQYFLDGLSALKDEIVEVKFSGPLSPAAITANGKEDFLYIVMPVKSQR